MKMLAIAPSFAFLEGIAGCCKGVFVILLLIAWPLGSLLIASLGFKSLRQRRLIRQMPFSKVRSIAVGPVKLTGKVSTAAPLVK